MIIEVNVKPNAKNIKLEKIDETLKVSLKSAPIEGKANEELIKLLAKKTKIPRSSFTVKHGQKARKKLLEVIGIEKDDFLKKID